jgi:hypothetical protein
MADEVEVAKSPGFVTLAEGTIASDYALKNLNKSLGDAQIEFIPAVKGEVNNYGGYKYTPLVVIIDAVRPSLHKFHLTVSQFPVTDLATKTITIHSRLVHWDSGEWMQNALELPAELALGKGGTPVFNQQTIGGSQTYAQKYAYKAIVGIPDSEEMIDSTEEKGDLPSRQKRQADARASAQQRASAISHPENAPRATSTQQSAQQATQRAASPQEGAQPQAGVLKFVPPNGLTAVVKRVREIQGLPAKPANGDVPAMKAVRPRLIVTFLGQHNGVDEASCFDTGLFDAIRDAVGLECHFQIAEKDSNGKHYINIEDCLYVDGVPYVDGKPSVDTATGEVIAERDGQ